MKVFFTGNFINFIFLALLNGVIEIIITGKELKIKTNNYTHHFHI